MKSKHERGPSVASLNFAKKLIEVSLPLNAINKAATKEKKIRHGHPSTLHLWWARRPLAAARAVIFAQMVDDPSQYADELIAKHAETNANNSSPSREEMIENERERLFQLLEELVVWENTTNKNVIERARAEIWNSWRRTCAQMMAAYNPPPPPG